MLENLPLLVSSFWLEKNIAGHCLADWRSEENVNRVTVAQRQAKWNVLYDRGKIGSCTFRQIGLEELPRLEEESDFVKCSSLEQRLAREQIWNSPEASCMEAGRKDEVASWRVEDRGASSQARMAAFAGNVGDVAASTHCGSHQWPFVSAAGGPAGGFLVSSLLAPH